MVDGVAAEVIARLPIILGALAVLSLLALLFWLTRRTLKESSANTELLLRILTRRQEEKLKIVTAELVHLKELSMSVVRLRVGVARINQMVQSIELTLNSATAEVGMPDPPSYYELPAQMQKEDVALFPSSANALLATLGGQEPTITLELLRNILIRDLDGKGEFVLVQDPRVPDGQFYIVPRITRLLERADFFNHYMEFYECDAPRALSALAAGATQILTRRISITARLKG